MALFNYNARRSQPRRLPPIAGGCMLSAFKVWKENNKYESRVNTAKKLNCGANTQKAAVSKNRQWAEANTHLGS